MYRRLILADAAALAALDAVLPEHEIQRNEAEFQGFLAQPAACCYGWEGQGQLLAYVLFTHAADSADLCHIVTLPDCRGQGIAKRLLQQGLKDLAALGVTEVFLEVQVGNEPAERLYSLLGAEQVGLRPGYYSLPGGGRADARVLRLLTLA